MKPKTAKVLETGLFIFGCVGVVATAISAGRDTLKAEKIVNKVKYKKRSEFGLDFDGDWPENEEKAKITKKEVVKATWKCFIPTLAITTLTISSFIVSKRLTAKEIAALSTAVASAGGLVTKYRQAILERTDEDILNQIDKEVAEQEIVKAKSPVNHYPTS